MDASTALLQAIAKANGHPAPEAWAQDVKDHYSELMPAQPATTSSDPAAAGGTAA